jgi:tetratricopeptide (TPR) repeat protein
MNPRRLAGHPLRAVVLASWVLFTVGARPAFASDSLPTQPEYFLLPEYCQAIVAEEIRSQPRLRHNLTLLPPTAIQRWRLRIGPDFEHLNHYCSGLRALSRALDLSTPRNQRGKQFGIAKEQIEISFMRSRPGSPLWSDMSLKYARALEGVGDRREAALTYQDLFPAYASLPEVWIEYAAFLKRTGKLNDAISLLEKGLEAETKKGPLLFWLANYYYDLGDWESARSTAIRAESAGMKMDRLKRKLGGFGEDTGEG